MNKETFERIFKIDESGQIDFTGTSFEHDQDARLEMQEVYDKFDSTLSIKEWLDEQRQNNIISEWQKIDEKTYQIKFNI